MQLAHLALEQRHDAFGRLIAAAIAPFVRGVQVAGHDLEIVQPAEQILDSPESDHQAAGGHAPELVDQFEGVSKLLGGDADPVEPVQHEQRARVGHRRLQPVGAAGQPLPEQERAGRLRPAGHAVGQAGQFIEQASCLQVAHLPGHLLPAPPAVGLDADPGRGQHVGQLRMVATERVEDADGDVELADLAEGRRNPAQPPPQLPGRALAPLGQIEPQHGQDFAQAARRHARAVHGLDVIVEHRGQVALEGAHAAGQGALGGRCGHSHRRRSQPARPGANRL